MGFGRDDRPREMHKATCGDCGNECEIPFEPRQDRPVYCNECFPKHKPARSDRGGGRFGRGGGSRFGGRGGGRFGGRNDRGRGRFGDRRPREMHTATCGDCGNECEIPFAPRQDRPVYCNECFPKHKPARSDRGGGRFGGRGGGRFGGRNDRGRGRFGDRRPRVMHTATCGDCGNECQIPFEPKDGRPVYCNECFPNHRNQRRD